MKDLMLQKPEIVGLLIVLLMPICISIALAFLLIKGKQERFYPAMPFLTIGCIAGFILIKILSYYI